MVNPSKPLGPTTSPAWAFSDASAVLARPLRLLASRQFGFRKYSTIYTLVYFTECVRNELNGNKFTTCAFMDLSKALDSINLTILLEKFEKSWIQ